MVDHIDHGGLPVDQDTGDQEVLPVVRVEAAVAAAASAEGIDGDGRLHGGQGVPGAEAPAGDSGVFMAGRVGPQFLVSMAGDRRSGSTAGGTDGVADLGSGQAQAAASVQKDGA